MSWEFEETRFLASTILVLFVVFFFIVLEKLLNSYFSESVYADEYYQLDSTGKKLHKLLGM